MVFRQFFNYLVNNPKLIEKLSDSYPIRRAAQLTVYAYRKGKTIGEEVVEGGLKQTTQRISSFVEKFKEELDRGMQEVSSQEKKRR